LNATRQLSVRCPPPAQKLTGVNRPFVPPTPVSPPVLLGEVHRLRVLLDGLEPLLDLGLPPGLKTLRRDVELALGQPESLETAENQLDFIEELAEAVWGEPAASLTSSLDGASPSPGPGHSGRQPVAESWEQLERLSERLCHDAETWHRRRTANAVAPLPSRLHSPV
jgi:hypothetical protein